MTRVGCTGHQNLSAATRRDVAMAITAILASETDEDLVGLCSLAEGADQLFAFAVLASGGQLHAVIPSKDYEQGFQSGRARTTYTALLGLAASSKVLAFDAPTEDAFLAAGHEVADQCDLLLAVWDGQGAGGKGGTADVVAYARERGIETRIIWPLGARRS
jgi:hypothetical protein